MIRTFIISGIVITVFFIFNVAIAQDDMSFLLPPRLIKNPATVEDYSVKNRKVTMVPSIAVSRNGRFWATWYAGITPGENRNNYVVLATSDDQGETWEEILVIDPDGPGPVRAFDPQVWIDPDGKLWFFWAQSKEMDHFTYYNGVNTGVWALTTYDSDIKNPSWSEPWRITDGIMMNKPVVLSTGEWVLPVSTWRTQNGAKVVVSTDNGNSWKVRGAVDVPESVWNCDEHMIIERKDGSLWMLVRTTYGIGESISVDRGRNWTPLVPSGIQHATARFFIARLHSGNLLLVKHGPIEMRTRRSHLMAFISRDDGFTWSRGLLLDERMRVTYPDGQQTSDGTIYITYDFERTRSQEILMTSFREDDINCGSDIRMIEVFQRRKVVSKGGTD